MNDTITTYVEQIRAHKHRMSKADFSYFGRNIARMKEFDEDEVVGTEASMLERVVRDVLNPRSPEFLNEFAPRRYVASIEHLGWLFTVYNKLMEGKAFFAGSLSYSFDTKRIGETLNSHGIAFAIGLPGTNNLTPVMKKALDDSKIHYETDDRRKYYFRINDQIEGASGVIVYYKTWTNEQELYACPRNNPSNILFKIGNLYTGTEQNLGARRFMYAFGAKPATEIEIIDVLVNLNGFPPKGTELPQLKATERRYVDYTLVPDKIENLKPTKGALLIYTQAMQAREQGLFKEVEVYKLKSQIRIVDPVIVGIDHFGNKYPAYYWAGDEK